MLPVLRAVCVPVQADPPPCEGALVPGSGLRIPGHGDCEDRRGGTWSAGLCVCRLPRTQMTRRPRGPSLLTPWKQPLMWMAGKPPHRLVVWEPQDEGPRPCTSTPLRLHLQARPVGLGPGRGGRGEGEGSAAAGCSSQAWEGGLRPRSRAESCGPCRCPCPHQAPRQQPAPLSLWAIKSLEALGREAVETAPGPRLSAPSFQAGAVVIQCD